MNELTYTRIRDYMLPNLILPQQPDENQPLGRYARMHRAYLREHRLALYNQLLLTGKLYPLLLEIDEATANRLAAGMPEEKILAELVYDPCPAETDRLHHLQGGHPFQRDKQRNHAG